MIRFGLAFGMFTVALVTLAYAGWHFHLVRASQADDLMFDLYYIWPNWGFFALQGVLALACVLSGLALIRDQRVITKLRLTASPGASA